MKDRITDIVYLTDVADIESEITALDVPRAGPSTNPFERNTNRIVGECRRASERDFGITKTD